MGECNLLNKPHISFCVTMYMTFVMIPVYTFFFSFVLQLHLHTQSPLKSFMVLSRLLSLDDKSMGRLISSIYILLFIFIMGRSITPPGVLSSDFCDTVPW
ncbi:uncharacterized protein APUU_21368A [Aspergillus puulaauensis]|uniref:Uncharacterized protein n=1 Tax=Aspergillus puulaauensis TaxID=1220207 RepID=A0A7R8AJA4_9EURO|nr:uncharacterized protein APUU_21368A [Aspergillus puulaauensis]BCS20936.1 hypothetical protein APUU_21368A [Aspergillus puulaauensis]